MRIAKKLRNMGENQENDQSIVKTFQFKRIKPNNLKHDNKEAKNRQLGSLIGDLNANDKLDHGEMIYYQVPSARSGHRAVCDEQNLWIWGGYCPNNHSSEEDEENSQNGSSAMLSEVFNLFMSNILI